MVNLFLYDVREDLDGQSSDEVDVRDGDGRVVARQRPPRKYQLSYLASAWCGDAEVEHELLGAILATVPNEQAIPESHLGGRLLEQGLPVRIKVGTPVTGANTWDLWAALGTPPRTAVEIVVTATLVPELSTELAPPAVEMELGVKKEQPGAIGAPEPVPSPAAEVGDGARGRQGDQGGQAGQEEDRGADLGARVGGPPGEALDDVPGTRRGRAVTGRLKPTTARGGGAALYGVRPRGRRTQHPHERRPVRRHRPPVAGSGARDLLRGREHR